MRILQITNRIFSNLQITTCHFILQIITSTNLKVLVNTLDEIQRVLS